MKNLFLVAFTGLLIYSCSNSTQKTDKQAIPADNPKQNQLVITNDMEIASTHVPSWNNERTVIEMKNPAAHSGKYACVTNDTIEYSYTYQELFKNIHTGVPKMVTVDGWVYSTAVKPNFSIVLNVTEKGNQYDWKVFPLADSLTETNKWVKFSNTFYMEKPLNPEQEIKIFGWNQSKKTVYIDDFKFTFEY
jgi:hypothetical protein